MDFNHLCMGCMSEKGEAETCPHCGWVEKTEAEEPAHLPPRTILNNRYLIGRVLGFGGFGVTYLAWDGSLEIKLAIKEYLPQNLATRTPGYLTLSVFSGEAKTQFEHGLNKFLEEAKTLAQFGEHPGIISVRDFFKANGTAYLVMPFLDGLNLKQYLDGKGGKIPVDSAVEILMPVFDALREVHSVGILHRDVSPDNVFITKTRQVKLLDFGAARHAMGEYSKSLSIILKPGYAPEEQYRSKGKQGPWSDVYSAGAVLYRSITGELPPEALDRLEEDTLVPPSKLGIGISPQIEAAILKALAVRANDRFQSIKEFQEALGKFRPVRREIPHVTSSSIAQGADVEKESVKPSRDQARKKGILTPILIAVCIMLGVMLLVVSINSIPHDTKTVNKGVKTLGDTTAKDGETKVPSPTDKGGENKLNEDKSAEDNLKSFEEQIPLVVEITKMGEGFAAVFAPKGNLLATTASTDGDSIVLINTSTWEVEESLNGVWATALSFFPETRFLAYAGEGVKFWNVENGSFSAIPDYDEEVYALTYSPDGKYLAAGDKYGKIKIWDAVTLETVYFLEGHTDSVQGIAFSPDGNYLASGSNDETVKIWSLNTGIEEFSFEEHKEVVYSVAFSPDSNLLASAAEDGIVRIWNVETGECKEIIDVGSPCRSIAFSAKKDLLVIAASESTVFYDLESRKLLPRLSTSHIDGWCVAISPEGQTVATRGDSNLKVWDLSGLNKQ